MGTEVLSASSRSRGLQSAMAVAVSVRAAGPGQAAQELAPPMHSPRLLASAAVLRAPPVGKAVKS